MATVDPEEFWRNAINEMSASLPDDGSTPPEIESIKPVKKPVREGNKKVLVHKVLTSIYIITDVEGKMYTASTSQKMQILGTMTLSKALKIAQEDSFG